MSAIILHAILLLAQGECPTAEFYSDHASWEYSLSTGGVSINDCQLPTTDALPAAMVRMAFDALDPA